MTKPKHMGDWIAPPPPIPDHDPRDPRHQPLNGPADWPKVREACGLGLWRVAYHAALCDREAEAYIEAEKAAALAALTADWRARKEHPR